MRSELEQPTVTVVIPCYKHAHLLSEAIESVLAQTYRHFEIIVVDDGSPDDTSAVVARYLNVRLVRQHHLGLPAARNAGLRSSEGDLVVFLDADDLLLPDALASGVDAFADHPECAFVVGKYKLVDLDRRVLGPGTQPTAAPEPYLSLLTANYITMHATVMFRRDILIAVGGFDESLDSCEDYDLYLRITRTHPIHFHGKVVSEYRQHDTNMSHDASRMLKGAISVLRKQKSYIRGRREYEQAYRAGVQYYQHYYGEPLVEQIRTKVNESFSRSKALNDALVLLLFHPRAFAWHCYRKLYCSLSKCSD